MSARTTLRRVSTSTPRDSLATLSGTASPLWLVLGATGFGLSRNGYDATHAISELGAQGAPNALLWNVVGFGFAALLFALWSTGVRRWFGDGWLFRLVLLQAIALALSGTFGCDPGCPAVMTTWQGWAHTVVGLTFFALTFVVPLVAWRTTRSMGAPSRVSMLGSVALFALFVASPFIFGASGVGLWQRITLVSYAAWIAGVSLARMRLPAGATAIG